MFLFYRKSPNSHIKLLGISEQNYYFCKVKHKDYINPVITYELPDS